METDTAPGGSSSLLNTAFFNDRGLRAGWRLLIYISIVVALVQLLSFLASRVRPPSHNTVLGPGIQIIIEAIALLCFLLAAYIMSLIERRSMREYGLPLRRQHVLRRFIVGYIFWGFLPLTICLAVMHQLHVFEFGGLALHGADIARFGLEWMIGFALVGLAEEFLLRGYALYTLSDGLGFWPAAIILAALFGFGHSFNPGETRIGLVGTVVFALFASVALRLTGNLWLAVGAHAGWDWGQSFFYGVPDSGMVAQGHLLAPSFHGPVWLSGGTVGPEGSLVTLVLWSLMIVVFVIIYRRRRPALIVVAETKT
ncbi:MAG TPA: type II CAAX endopeptidase family protein [Candidatus Angelobacter sp.]|nr:type II CAAX endopeptidase family protein [Candidatus Angelobacter sp.]